MTPKTTFDVYQAELSPKLFLTIKYYFLRIAGFAETSGDEIVSFVLLGWLILIALMLVNMLKKRLNINLAIFSIVVISAGLFPFILIPQHLSPHYMNVSIFGFAMLVGIILKTTRRFMAIATIVIFLIISGYNINLTIKNNWVIERSNLARTYVEQIYKISPPSGSTLIFKDNKLSTSKEAYISLGTGDAVKFFFPEKNYQTCFAEFELCTPDSSNTYVLGN